MTKTIEELIKRQSTRVYLDKEISQEIKEDIIEAAVNAPSAGNMQLYSIIDVEDKEKVKQLSILCDHQPFIEKAKMVWVICADYQKWIDAFDYSKLQHRHPDAGDLLLSIEDALIVAQNAVTAAQSYGIGSCYIGDIMENYEEIVKLFNLPPYVYPACMVVFGYIDYNHLQKEKPKRVDNKYVVFKDEYHRLNEDEVKDMFKDKCLTLGYEKWIEAFMQRKYNSDFSAEMSRSANKYIERYKKD